MNQRETFTAIIISALILMSGCRNNDMVQAKPDTALTHNVLPGNQNRSQLQSAIIDFSVMLTEESIERWYDHKSTDRERIRQEMVAWADESISTLNFSPKDKAEELLFLEAIQENIELTLDVVVQANLDSMEVKKQRVINEIKAGRATILIPLPDGFMPADNIKRPHVSYAFMKDREKTYYCDVNIIMKDSLSPLEFAYINKSLAEDMPDSPPEILSSDIVQNDQEMFSLRMVKMEESGSITFSCTSDFLVDGKVVSLYMQRHGIENKEEMDTAYTELMKWRKEILEANLY